MMMFGNLNFIFWAIQSHKNHASGVASRAFIILMLGYSPQKF
jgi:hypothetical protein